MGIRDFFGLGQAQQLDDQHEAFRERAQARQAERAAKRRRVLMPLGYVVVTGALIGGFLYSPLTAVGKIEVLGPITQGQREQTQAQLDGLIGRHMIEVRADEVNALVKRQHWVEATSMTKQWPQTISVQLAVREPAIVVQSPTGEWAMDAGGFFIGPADERMAHLTRVRTQASITDQDATGTPGLVAAARAVTVFPQTLKDYVSQWAVDDTVGLVVDMKPVGVGGLQSVQVIIGDAEEIPYKASTIEAMLQDLAAKGHTSSKIDVRVPSRPVVIG